MLHRALLPQVSQCMTLFSQVSLWDVRLGYVGLCFFSSFAEILIEYQSEIFLIKNWPFLQCLDLSSSSSEFWISPKPPPTPPKRSFFSVAPTKVSTCVPIQANDQVLRAPFRPRRYSNTYHYTIQTQQTERRLSYIFFGIMRGFKVLACLVIAYANVSNFIVYYIITLPGQASLPISPLFPAVLEGQVRNLLLIKKGTYIFFLWKLLKFG